MFGGRQSGEDSGTSTDSRMFRLLDQQTKQQLKDDFPKIKSQLKQQFPDLEERDMQQVKSDPDGLVRAIAQKSGQDQFVVERQVAQLVQAGSSR